MMDEIHSLIVDISVYSKRRTKFSYCNLICCMKKLNHLLTLNKKCSIDPCDQKNKLIEFLHNQQYSTIFNEDVLICYNAFQFVDHVNVVLLSIKLFVCITDHLITKGTMNHNKYDLENIANEFKFEIKTISDEREILINLFEKTKTKKILFLTKKIFLNLTLFLI